MPTIVATRVRAPTQSVRLVFHIGVIERATACSTLFWILDDQAPVVVIDGFHNHEVILVEPGHERGDFRVSELSALRVSNIARAEDDTVGRWDPSSDFTRSATGADGTPRPASPLQVAPTGSEHRARYPSPRDGALPMCCVDGTSSPGFNSRRLHLSGAVRRALVGA